MDVAVRSIVAVLNSSSLDVNESCGEVVDDDEAVLE